MLVAVKAPRTEFKVEGQIPKAVLADLKRRYGKGVRVLDPEADELVDLFASEWYRKAKRRSTPGATLKALRENRGLTQAALARRLGGGTRKQHVSAMERGRRAISKRLAKRLAAVFRTSPARFI